MDLHILIFIKYSILNIVGSVKCVNTFTIIASFSMSPQSFSLTICQEKEGKK